MATPTLEAGSYPSTHELWWRWLQGASRRQPRSAFVRWGRWLQSRRKAVAVTLVCWAAYGYVCVTWLMR